MFNRIFISAMEVELKTAPVDKRFSNTNQARHCYA